MSDDDLFQFVLKRMKQEQLQKFSSCISHKMTRIYYLYVFISTFLCNGQNDEINDNLHSPAVDVYKPTKIAYVCDDNFDAYCYKLIEMRTYQQPIEFFFKKMVSLRTDADYISAWLQIYKTINGLEKCDSADNIWKCLEASKKVIIE